MLALRFCSKKQCWNAARSQEELPISSAYPPVTTFPNNLESYTATWIWSCYSLRFQGSVLAILSDNNPLKQVILDCRLHLQNLISLEKNITL
ncbi:hypothetical protein CEXT_490931 [Caerostris extrusa]|uniref:Uncharacterized protein n=1 Tax=Caerostris extrusa TaxID=172846 RepID=A0AAV4XP06_CAEEX|nr:hypothetical protein CEXT_490931 [Caerostris extrusa]